MTSTRFHSRFVGAGSLVAVTVALVAAHAAALATPVEPVRYEAVATLALAHRLPGPTISADVHEQLSRIVRMRDLPDSVAVRIWSRHGDRRVRVESYGPTDRRVAEAANTVAAELVAWDVGPKQTRIQNRYFELLRASRARPDDLKLRAALERIRPLAIDDSHYSSASRVERIEGPHPFRRGLLAMLLSLPLTGLAMLLAVGRPGTERLPMRRGHIGMRHLVLVGLLAAAAAIGVLAGSGEWAYSALIASFFSWVVFGMYLPVAAAGLATLTLFLPAYNLGIFASLGPGVGLFTCLAGALAVVAAWGARRSSRRLLGSPPVLATAAFGIVVLASVAAHRGAESLSVAKTLEARAVLLPLVVLLVFWQLRRDEQTRLENVLTSVLLGVGLAGAVLSIFQVAFGVGYVAAGFGIEQFEGKRAIGFSEHPATWAAFLMLPLAISAARWTRPQGRWWLVSVFAICLGVILTGDRAAWIAMLAIGAFVLARSTNRARVMLITSLVVAGAIALAIPNFRTALKGGSDGAAVRLFSGRLGADESARFRLVLFHAELDLALRHPLMGVGLGNVGPAMRELDGDYLKNQQLVTPGAPVDRHNAYLGVVAELGLPGLVAFLGALAVALIGYRRALVARIPERSDYARGLMWALFAVAVIAASVDADRGVIFWWLVGAGFALGYASSDYAPAAQPSTVGTNRARLAWVASRFRRSGRSAA